MSKAYLLNDRLNAADRATLEAAVRSAGHEPVRSTPSDVSSLAPGTDIGVVGLPVAPEDEMVIDARMRAFAGVGVRVVCIWLRETVGLGAGVPEGVGKYGTTVGIESPELTRALNGEADVWEEPGGAQSPAPRTKRNRC